MDEPVLIEETDGILTLTLNRPSSLNALNGAMAGAVANAMDELDARTDLRAAIITGDQRAFSAGMDIKAFAAGDRPSIPGRGLMGFAERSPQKPVIAAVEGWALGAGFELALACDLVVASQTAVFGLPEAKRGLVAAGGGLVRLAQRVPYAVALDIAITCRNVAADEAHRLGLVTRVAEPGEALASARELAADIARSAPLSVRASKQIIRAAANWAVDDGYAAQEKFLEPLYGAADVTEGAKAFIEKREPVWSGR